MRKIDAVFLSSVLGVAAVLLLQTLSRTVPLLPGKSAVQAAAPGTAGKPRDVDMRKLQRQIDQGYLSTREAEFYKEFSAGRPLEEQGRSGEDGGAPSATAR